MSKYRLRSVNDNWGGVLNLTLGNTMTKEECLETIKKFEDISQNKFYTINVYDSVTNTYLGDSELTLEESLYRIRHSVVKKNTVIYYTYNLYKVGKYTRSVSSISLSEILSRLDTIEQKLGI